MAITATDSTMVAAAILITFAASGIVKKEKGGNKYNVNFVITSIIKIAF